MEARVQDSCSFPLRPIPTGRSAQQWQCLLSSLSGDVLLLLGGTKPGPRIRRGKASSFCAVAVSATDLPPLTHCPAQLIFFRESRGLMEIQEGNS